MTNLDKFRVSILVGACVFLGGGWVARAHAAEGTKSRCTAIAGPKAAIKAQHGSWITLTKDQWNFLRGVYALNPNTAPGLPPGDRAALAQVSGKDGGLVFFLDGALACTPMLIPKPILTMTITVGAGEVDHEGEGL